MPTREEETLINPPAKGENQPTTMTVTAQERAQEQLLDIIVKKDDVSWKALIFGLIESEQMDPWDISISLLSRRFLDELKRLKEMDFRISGKVVLASAILLKLKADRLQTEDLAALDNIIQSVEEPMELGLDDLTRYTEEHTPEELPALIPRTPQPRKRKVSVYDLVEALEEALELEANRPERTPARVLDTIEPPENHIDISVIIREIYDKVHHHYEVRKNPAGSLRFTHLTRSEDPRDKVMTFIPLLHLETARKVEMEQAEHFGPINVHLLDTTPPTMTELAEQLEE